MERPVSYLQTDAKWKALDYSAKGEYTTIGASGCGPTAMAMVLATWVNPAITPATECAWALKNGFKCLHSGTYYGYFVPAGSRYGLTVTRLNTANIYGNSQHAAHAQAKAALEKGDLVIACMGKGNWTKSGHYVLCWKIEGNVIYINDPASTKLSRTQGDYSLFKTQVKFYWAIQCPDREDDDMSETEVRKLLDEMQDGLERQVKELSDAVKTMKNDISGVAENLHDEDCAYIVRKAARHIKELPEPEWSQKEGRWAKATEEGIVDGTNPEGYVKRDEVVAILGRAMEQEE